MDNQLQQQLLLVVSTPISQSSPVGDDLRYDEEYEAIEREISKQSSLYDQGKTDWALVQEQSMELLRSRCKDLRIGCWLARAVWHRQGLMGMIVGLTMLNELINLYWDNIHPKRIRSRLSALDFYFSKITDSLSDSDFESPQQPQLQLVIKQLEQADQFFAKNLAEDAPLLLPAIRRLKETDKRFQIEKERSQAQTIAEPKASGSVISQMKQVASQLFSGPAAEEIENEVDAQRALRQLQDYAHSLRTYFLQRDLSDSRPYRLNRALTWCAVVALPPCNDKKQTKLKALSLNNSANYQERMGRKEYPTLLPDLETSVSKAPFWFDGHQMSWRCLDALGYKVAAESICWSMAEFLLRFPEIIDLQFDDGTPFVSEETREWLAIHVYPLNNQYSDALEPVLEFHGGGHEPWNQALEEAKRQVKLTSLNDAIRPLQQGLAQATHGRDRCFWQLSLARFCFMNRKFNLACSLLEQLDQRLTEHQMVAWEPELVTQVLLLWRSCLDKMPHTDVTPVKRESIHARLCCLDISTVLEN